MLRHGEVLQVLRLSARRPGARGSNSTFHPTEPAATRHAFTRLLRSVRREAANDELQAIRIQVRHHIADLRAGRKLPLAPDRVALEKTIARLEESLEEATKKNERAEAAFAEAEGRQQYWEAQLRQLRRQKPKGRRFVGPDP